MLLLDCESRGFADKALEYYRQRLTIFLCYCDKQQATTLPDLTPTLIRAFLVGLQQRQKQGKISSAYAHSFARAIRTFCYFLVREELLDVSPFAKVKMPRLEKKVLPALTSEEVKAILRACEYERDKVLVLFLLDSGVRASELCALNVGDVDGEGRLRCARAKGRLTYIGARTLFD